ncbi:SAM-dependent chlorinase/fluorinase [Thermogutta sp.]|jgi:S-adenosylmethionine hydrolase|uniref:SAM hydrolase/SAM-dependent halogenase family protein n=1 Tax=Thermogutta sp. TaxID=1962930 RepID=UPI00321FF268
MAPLVTLTTDFGRDSIYVAQLKAVLLSINPRLTLVDVTHEIPPQDVVSGAWILRHTVPYFPEGSFHLAVVDPGVGTARRCLAVDWESRYVVAPDNGLVTFLCQLSLPRKIVWIENRAYFRAEVSSTFHARDIMGPALAWLTQGVPLEELGPLTGEWVQLAGDWRPRITDREIEGRVVFVDRFGNLITNIEKNSWPKHATPVIKVGDHQFAEVSRTYGEHRPGDLIALFGSQGYLEIAVVNGSAAERTKLTVGTPVLVTW